MAYSEYANLYTLSVNPGSVLKIAGTATPGTYTVTENDGTSDGAVTAGQTVDVNGTTYTYTGQTFEGGIIVQNGGTTYLLTDNTYANNTNVGKTTNTPSDYTYAVCFLPGTLIATPVGERAIESLKPGDQIVTAAGEHKAVRWVGEMTVELDMFSRRTATPVLIRAGALGNGLPKRDLYTSYHHGFEIEGVLVIAGLLVNGTSILQCTDWEGASVKYYQVDVADHELMVVEGTAAETYWDSGDTREKFDNAAEFHAMYPNAVPAEHMALGRVTYARQLPRVVKARLDAAAIEMGYVKAVAA